VRLGVSAVRRRFLTTPRHPFGGILARHRQLAVVVVIHGNPREQQPAGHQLHKDHDDPVAGPIGEPVDEPEADAGRKARQLAAHSVEAEGTARVCLGGEHGDHSPHEIERLMLAASGGEKTSQIPSAATSALVIGRAGRNAGGVSPPASAAAGTKTPSVT